jgi:hypothetical protein
VISAIIASRELGDGCAFRVDLAKASLMDVAQWLELWRPGTVDQIENVAVVPTIC